MPAAEAERTPPPGAAAEVERLRVRVLASFPHDPQAFTQGLLWHAGSLYESTGLYGRSTLRRWQPGGKGIAQQVELPRELFGEGLALVGERLVQLTWREGRARLYDLASFELLGELAYQGEGWGLCNDGRRLVMTDGGSDLTFRDPETLAELGRVEVTYQGRPLSRLNELECVGDRVWANVLGEEVLVRVDPGSGAVDAVVDASGLLAPEERPAADVLNGVAYRPETDSFFLTGKLWPRLFEVELVPALPR